MVQIILFQCFMFFWISINHDQTNGYLEDDSAQLIHPSHLVLKHYHFLFFYFDSSKKYVILRFDTREEGNWRLGSRVHLHLRVNRWQDRWNAWECHCQTTRNLQIRETTCIHEHISRYMTKTDNLLRMIPSNIVTIRLIQYSYSCSLGYACQAIEEPLFPCHHTHVLIGPFLPFLSTWDCDSNCKRGAIWCRIHFQAGTMERASAPFCSLSPTRQLLVIRS